MPEDKSFRTIDEQVELLDGRKLKFKDKEKSKRILLKYNYFDVINGFESIFLKTRRPKTYDNVYFEDFYDSFIFDLNLKNYTLLAILKLESNLRTSISYHFSELYCNTQSTTMNYIDPTFYCAPPASDTHLTNVFNKFVLFRQTTYYPGTTRVMRRSFIDELKAEKDYVNTYNNPPFWVTIKSLPLGSLYYLYVFLPTDVRKLVLNDFGLDIHDDAAFTQAICILKEMRNQCAHLELITRFKMKPDTNLNCYNDIKAMISETRINIGYINVLQILNLFTEIKPIKKCIRRFYLKMVFKKRKGIALKVLGKMGNQKIKVWKKI